MDDKYNFMQRLHALAVDLPTLETFYAEYQTFADLTPEEEEKFEREIAHVYYEVTGDTYEDGDL